MLPQIWLRTMPAIAPTDDLASNSGEELFGYGYWVISIKCKQSIAWESKDGLVQFSMASGGAI
jgi:hypothetical protein